MDSEWNKQRMIYQQKIELLNDQLQQYGKRQVQHKLLNDHLMNIVNNVRDHSEQINKLNYENQQLRKNQQQQRKRHQYIENHNQIQISKLKEELREKNREIERSNVQQGQQILQFQQQIAILQKSIKEYHKKMEFYQSKRNNCRKLDSSTHKQSFIDDIYDYTIRNNEENEIRLSNMRKGKVEDYMKLDKTELKVIVASLKKAQQKLDQGNHNISSINQANTLRVNKTFHQ